ncbi:MAG: efflux RND transporter periplasmic adaptor subunit [Planctomycetes bacterium]|nr:efflux RND transporter periplasmic adaptor subunit [Planctomycetota bacterium]
MKVSPIAAVILGLVSLSLSACDRMHAEEKESHEQQKIVVTNPETRNVTITIPYVCQIRSQRNIEIKALQEGYLEEIHLKEGQAVKRDEVMFKVRPVLYQTRLDAERAKANTARIKYENTWKLYNGTPPVVSIQEVRLAEAELAEADAKVKNAEAELNFATVRAPFDGIIDRLYKQQGSLVKKDEILTVLSDNSLMWVYFNVPEAQYLDYKRRQGKTHDPRLTLADSKIELRLADGSIFDQSPGNTVTIEGKVNNETGNIAFRADFPNPDGLLRHGQTGTILIHRTKKNAIVIPQRATFEILDKQYVWVVGEDHVVHQRLITVEHELEDIFVIKSGLELKDKIILEGVQQVHENEKVEYEFHKPGEATHPKYHAE